VEIVVSAGSLLKPSSSCPTDTMIVTTCDVCGGDNLSQAASMMIHLKDAMDNTYEFDWGDLQWDDYYYCHDCEDDVPVTESEDSA